MLDSKTNGSPQGGPTLGFKDRVVGWLLIPRVRINNVLILMHFPLVLMSLWSCKPPCVMFLTLERQNINLLTTTDATDKLVVDEMDQS